jgi:death-on-curing protein
MSSRDDLPDDTQIIEIHDWIEAEYSLKHTGSRVPVPGLRLREDVLEPVAEEDGTYCRAAGLLRKIITTHVFEDANKRTAWTVTVLYLEDHDAEPADRDTERVERVLKRIRRYDIEEIAEWLATGEIDEDRLKP